MPKTIADALRQDAEFQQLLERGISLQADAYEASNLARAAMARNDVELTIARMDVARHARRRAYEISEKADQRCVTLLIALRDAGSGEASPMPDESIGENR